MCQLMPELDTHREIRVRSIAVVAALLVLGGSLLLVPQTVDARGEKRVDFTTFMAGLACTESGGRFEALNDRSGAYGKYQIMPRNWLAWADRYMGNRWAQPTPRNQEFVARQRVLDLFEKRGDWRRVAYWWLTGDGEGNQSLWTGHALGYVNRVMRVAVQAATPGFVPAVPERCFPIAYPDPVVRTEPFPRVWVIGGRVNVRSAPGYENRAVSAVKRGDRLVVLGKRDDPRGEPWLKIGLSDGQTGWVARWFTRPD